MPLLVLVVLAVWAAAEIVAVVLVAHVVGAGPAVLLLLACVVVGAIVARRSAAAAAARLQRSRSAGPGAAHGGAVLANAAVLGVAGVLLVVPGFLGFAAGAVLLLPPVRAVVARGLARLAAQRLARMVQMAARGPFGGMGPAGGAGGPASGPGFGGPWGRPGGGAPGDVIDGTATEAAPADASELPPERRDGLA